MKIITVIGKSDTGKTTLIKSVYESLKRQGAFVLYYDVTGAHYEDIRAVVIWRGKTIAFCSIGDWADDDYKINGDLWHLSYIKEGIEIARGKEADILINALTSNIQEDDYKKLLRNIFSNDTYISCNMQSNIFQKDCIKQNQEKLEFIIKEIS